MIAKEIDGAPADISLKGVRWGDIERTHGLRQREWKKPASLEVRMIDAMRAVCIGFCADTVSAEEMRAELGISFTTEELDGPSDERDGLTNFQKAWHAVAAEIVSASAPKP